MNIPVRHMPWIGGAADAAGASFSPLVSPIDETIASQIVESNAAIVDAAVKHAHAAYLKHMDATTAKRVEWLLAAADTIDKIEVELVRSLIRDIGKPRRAATFESKRAGAFIRACAAPLPHINAEVLSLDASAPAPPVASSSSASSAPMPPTSSAPTPISPMRRRASRARLSRLAASNASRPSV